MNGTAHGTALDPVAIRAAFPIFDQLVHGRRLIYLDSANTSQKPRAVIDATQHYYAADNANVHRATYLLGERATAAYEGARGKVQRFINAARNQEIVFTRGCTESINLVAGSWGRSHVKAGDEILITHLEHHSNIVPWQLLCEQTGATLRVVPIDEAGVVGLDDFRAALSNRTRLVSVIHVSN
ncbi:MAG: aminotransferase class V-fold PLP-dependent enzyme, partial [Vicinamibacterales bacterium]